MNLVWVNSAQIILSSFQCKWKSAFYSSSANDYEFDTFCDKSSSNPVAEPGKHDMISSQRWKSSLKLDVTGYKYSGEKDGDDDDACIFPKK